MLGVWCGNLISYMEIDLFIISNHHQNFAAGSVKYDNAVFSWRVIFLIYMYLFRASLTRAIFPGDRASRTMIDVSWLSLSLWFGCPKFSVNFLSLFYCAELPRGLPIIQTARQERAQIQALLLNITFSRSKIRRRHILGSRKAMLHVKGCFFNEYISSS